MKKFLRVIILMLLLLPFTVRADEVINIYLFHSSTCPHCKEAREYLENLEKEDKNIKVNLYRINEDSDTENVLLLDKVQELINGKSNYIPYIVIGSNYRVGFNNSTKVEIDNIIKAYKNGNYVDIVSGVKDGTITNENIAKYLNESKVKVDNTVEIPWLGKVNPKKVSLPLISVIIGLVDGFNPCAMWVLIFLISMLLGMNNKKKMWYLGSLFIFTSALVYLLFMIAWLTVIEGFSSIKWVQIAIAIVALIGAFLNIRSYIKERKQDSGCVVVDDKKRKKIFGKIKKFTQEKSLLLASIGVVALAISVNVVELACSAGLPVLFTNILSLNNLSTVESNVYILIYIFFFMLDDLIVFNVAMFTLKVTGITTKYTKYTHLIGGLIMLLIGVLLIFKPEWIMFNF